MDYRLQPEHTDRVSASHAPNSYPTTNSHSNDWNHPLSQPYPSSSRTTPGPSAATNFGSFGPSPPRLYPAPYGYTTEPPDEPQELTYTEQLEQQNEQYRDQVHLLTTRVASFEASQHQYIRELINKMAQPDRLTAPTPPVRKEDDPAFRQRVLWSRVRTQRRGLCSDW
ncbi:hypothetical protein PENSPDRAFT_328812 [Peniophora sp. CONT]|nr:hypothetical protein PENSPDRAFT_328812 [Peniophora sp. CONT]